MPLTREGSQRSVNGQGDLSRAASLQSVHSSSQSSSYKTQHVKLPQQGQQAKHAQHAQQGHHQQLAQQGQLVQHAQQDQHARKPQHSMHSGFITSVTVSARQRSTSPQPGHSHSSIVSPCSATVHSPEATSRVSIHATLSPGKQSGKSPAKGNAQLRSQGGLVSREEHRLSEQLVRQLPSSQVQQQLPEELPQHLQQQVLHLQPRGGQPTQVLTHDTTETGQQAQCRAEQDHHQREPQSLPGSRTVSQQLQQPARHSSTTPGLSGAGPGGPQPAASHAAADVQPSAPAQGSALPQQAVSRTGSMERLQQLMLLTRAAQHQQHTSAATSTGTPSQETRPRPANVAAQLYPSCSGSTGSAGSTPSQPQTGSPQRATSPPVSVDSMQQPVSDTGSGDRSQPQPVSCTVSSGSVQQRLAVQQQRVSCTVSASSIRQPLAHAQAVAHLQQQSASSSGSAVSTQGPASFAGGIALLQEQSQLALGAQTSCSDLSREGLEEDNCRLRYALAAIEQQLGLMTRQQVSTSVALVAPEHH